MTNPAPFPPYAYGPLGSQPALRVGYGAMQLEHVEPADATRVLRRAVELGVDHVDTAHFYGNGFVNAAIRTALHPYPADLQLATKVGAENASGGLVPAQRPSQLRAQVEANLTTLGVQRLSIVNLRRLDAAPGIVATGDQIVDLDIQLAELVALRDKGKIGAIGLSNVSIDQLRHAAPVGIACVQNLYNVLDRSDEPTLQECEGLGVAWIPFFPLGSAFSGRPRVIDDPTVIVQAERLGITPSRLGLAWLLTHSPQTHLIPGTRSVRHLEQNIDAARTELDDIAMTALDGLTQ
jgi:pyridoxine 4-dehydrogenase